MPSTTATDAPTAPLLLRDAQAAEMLGISRRTLWQLVSAGELPPPVKLPGVRATRWRYQDLVEWTEGLQ